MIKVDRNLVEDIANLVLRIVEGPKPTEEQ